MSIKINNNNFNFEARKTKSVLDLSTNIIELNLEDIKGVLGKEELLFRNGMWVTDSLLQINNEYRVAENETCYVDSINKAFKEENNVLKLKINICLNMLIKLSAEVQQSKKEYEHLLEIFKQSHQKKK